jgi:predicted metalloprotease
VLLFVLSVATGQDFLSILDPGRLPGEPSSSPAAPTRAEEQLVQFVSFVLDDNQQTWERVLGSRYDRAKLVLFRDTVDSACGFAEAATGPFYCPGDQKVYIDLGFFAELQRRFGAGGDFAQAYVLAHEIGHHVQALAGTEPRVREAMRANPSRTNDLSVRMELQADCYAGVWGHSTSERNLLEQGDVEEGLTAAAAIGDDRIQRMGGGRVAPERFTHGSSAQRVRWFRTGLESGRPESCDTFGGR